ncbi:MAG: riboflavin biosynthesis protein RibF [Bacilli bacterium]|nr:riboflavin biosynthesis protein RibF [Bacilli bacterium]
MDIIGFDLRKMPKPKKGLTLALGDFDGFHRGHRALLVDALFASDDYCGVLLFSQPFPGKGDYFLSSVADRLKWMGREPLDYAYVYQGDASVYQLSPVEFIEKILVPLGTVKVVCGEDYHYGKGGKGDIELLKKYFEVKVVPFVMDGDRKISTSYIKQHISRGEMEAAKRLLGRPYGIVGKTVQGNRLGRNIGFPTLNLHCDFPYLYPKSGVYFCLAYFKGRYYKAMVNVGNNPTVGQGLPKTVEAHLLHYVNYDAHDDYGFTLYLDFIQMLRPEMKFDGLSALAAQLQKDKAAVEAIEDLN